MPIMVGRPADKAVEAGTAFAVGFGADGLRRKGEEMEIPWLDLFTAGAAGIVGAALALYSRGMGASIGDGMMCGGASYAGARIMHVLGTSLPARRIGRRRIPVEVRQVQRSAANPVARYEIG